MPGKKEILTTSVIMGAPAPGAVEYLQINNSAPADYLQVDAGSPADYLQVNDA